MRSTPPPSRCRRPRKRSDDSGLPDTRPATLPPPRSHAPAMNIRRATALLGGLSLLSVLARLLQLQGLHPLVWDEIEFFRATDWVRRGLVPYRDFWEHHTPLQWFLFAPFT